jgi:hypothetical protein
VHFVGTTGDLPSDTESTVLLGFVVALDVSARCRAFLMRAPIPPFRLCNWRTPFSVLQKHTEGASQQVNGSHGVYAEGGKFCLSWERHR